MNSKLVELILNQPLLMSPVYRDILLRSIDPRFSGQVQTGQMQPVQPMPHGKVQPGQNVGIYNDNESRISGYRVENGVAIIGIYGLLLNRRISGYWAPHHTSYQDIVAAKDTAIRDDRVKAIFFDIDTGGGEAKGAFDAADNVFASRDEKPMFAAINETALSGGYLFAAAIGNIITPRTGSAGSVGVIASHFDWSKFDEEIGLNVTHVFAGDRKADFSPHKPLSVEAADILQRDVNQSNDLFVNSISRYRGMSEQSVRETQAGIYTGPLAVSIGFADSVASVDATMTAITEANGSDITVSNIFNKPLKERIQTMDIKEFREKHPELAKQVEADARVGCIAQDKHDEAIQAATGSATEVQINDAVKQGVDSVISVHAVISDEPTVKRLGAVLESGLDAAALKKLGVDGQVAGGVSKADQILAGLINSSSVPAGNVDQETPAAQAATEGASRVAAKVNASNQKAPLF